MSNSEFKTQGFFVTPPLLSEIELAQLADHLAAITSNSAAPKADDRHLLGNMW